MLPTHNRIVPSVVALGTMVEIFAEGLPSTPEAMSVESGGVAWEVTGIRGDRLLALVPVGVEDGPLTISSGASSATSPPAAAASEFGSQQQPHAAGGYAARPHRGGVPHH